MMNSETNDVLIKKYQEILKANGIENEISEVTEISPEEMKGTGMTSIALYVTVKFKEEIREPLHLFVKAQLSNESTNKMYESMKLWEKEVRFLTEYVPAVRQFCKSRGQESLVEIYPKCYFGSTDMIVLENLVTGKGYVLLSKQERQGLEPARIALTTLAKHHALSYAFIKENGGPDEFFNRFPNLNFEAFNQDCVKGMLEPLVENGVKTNIKLLEKNDVPGKEHAIEILEAYKGKAYSTMMSTINSPLEKEKLLTLNHGDYWNNNMMFLRDDENKMVGHVILDFQVVRYNSPALDIGNFMYTTMQPEARRKHLHELLSLYLDVLKSTSMDLGHPIEMSYDELFTLFRKKVKYGFWFATWLAVEVGYAVINDVDSDFGVTDWSTRFDKLVQNWIDKNPEKSVKCAEELVELMREYSDLVLD